MSKLMTIPECSALGELTATLVFAVCGRIGSGTSYVADKLLSELKTFGYVPQLIKVTKAFLEPIALETHSPASRIRELQNVGNRLRDEHGNHYLAVECIKHIKKDLHDNNVLLSQKHRYAYIIDSLKHPDEISLLKAVFADAFWVIGVVADDSVRKKRLQDQKQLTDVEFNDISEVDADQEISNGQNALKSILRSDYFFENNYDKETKINEECRRFLNLVFQETIDTSRQDEYGMHLAFMAADKSACLSRQVGAAVIAENGTVLSTGCNDVPRFGGGLYTSESDPDNRCFAMSQKCHNDYEKGIIADEIVAVINGIDTENRLDKASLKIALLKETRLKQLIEFSRAVHAEMDAIIDIARSGKIGLAGSTMYVTTYPCHNCAKHIIDAGIKRVVFVEPYTKSLAQQLHSDAINRPQDAPSLSKVSFDNYGGVSPDRYSSFFSMHTDRKKNSKLIRHQKINLFPLGAQNSEALNLRLSQFAKRYETQKAEVDAVSASEGCQISESL
jgi:deoxycytidylate deaminase